MSFTSSLIAPFVAARKGSPLLKIRRALALRKERRQLAKLDFRALQDIGITQADIADELSKSIWEAPSNRPYKCW